jgi:uncharacterized protein YkwD
VFHFRGFNLKQFFPDLWELREFAVLRLMCVFALATLCGCGGAYVTAPLGIAFAPDDLSVVASESVSRSSDPAGPATTPKDSYFGSMLNDYRISPTTGSLVLGSLVFNVRLNAAAQGHADDMLARNYFSHESPEGKTALNRILAQGYNPTAFAENLAKGYQSDAAVLKAWQGSPSHDDALRGALFKEFGLGVAGAGSNTHWVLVLATE